MSQFIDIKNQNSNGFTSSEPTDKFGWHKAYLPFYSNLFLPIKESTKKLLDIGGHVGGSFIMWENYFPNAIITGVDIHELKPACLNNHERIIFVSCDAYSPEGISKTNSIYDIIIDDGSHDKHHQVYFCKNYLEMLTKDGIAIIEDIQNPEYLKDIIRAIPMNFKAEIVDLRAINRRYDDILLVIKRK